MNSLDKQSPQILGMTPGTYRRFVKGEAIRYAITASPLGLMLVAATTKGLCRLALGDDRQALEYLLLRLVIVR
jgi:AraC family transcriptional regulator, regulatory protein of adaptative response / methylated-DNA-[protein]-cysteine methyltransferase